MKSPVSTLLTALRGAASFEDAASLVLELMLPELATATEGTEATVLRGMVHLRPGGSYAGVFVHELDHAAHPPARPDARLLPSSTAWHWVEQVRAPLVLDVNAGRALSADGQDLAPAQALLRDFRSREAVLGRHTTHIMAFPLLRPGGSVDGFVSIELSVADAVRFGPELAAGLQELAEVAAPFLRELPRASRDAPDPDPLLPVVGPSMRSRIDDLRLFASQDETLLLHGETGVGKSQLAGWCVRQSPRAERPFVPVNLATVPENLREGTLFGWIRGAFSGATESRDGLVAEAEGGTLFIDEIDKLPLSGQAILLSLLDDGQYRVLGDSALRHADVRFIVGTNADLRAEVEAGRFSRDLFYRIQVLPIEIPPLRARRDEIIPWAEHMIRGLQGKSGRDGDATLEPAAGALLAGQHWPGNLRQLHSVIKRAYTLGTRNAGPHVHVNLSCVQQALGYEGRPVSDDVLTAFERAAEAFVSVALARDGGLPLDHTKAFSGFVVREAVNRMGGDKRAACMLLGRAKHVELNNHQAMVKRELQRIDKLVAALHGEGAGDDS